MLASGWEYPTPAIAPGAPSMSRLIARMPAARARVTRVKVEYPSMTSAPVDLLPDAYVRTIRHAGAPRALKPPRRAQVKSGE